MKKTRCIYIVYTFLLICLLLPATASAADFGLILDQSAGVGGVEDAAFDYEATLMPRLSFLLGDSGDLHISAGMTIGYENEKPYYVPELLRTELTWRFDNAKINAGRMIYAAPYVAEGLFDGLRFTYNSPAGIFDIGAWYTGLLYKKNANIIISAEDAASYYSDLDYDDFSGTYFASKRMVIALGWEHPAIGELVRTRLAFTAQIDFNGNDNYLHSQYLTAKIGIPIDAFLFELGGALELMETDSDFGIGLAGELGIYWNLPTPFLSRLSFNGMVYSGRVQDGSVAAFTPINAKFMGNVLQIYPSGISTLALDYTARLHETLSAGLSSAYFVRNDLGTYAGYPVDMENKDEHFLGNEFFARFIWSPVSDLQINLGAGIFVPAMGNAAPGREAQWRVELSMLLALY